MRNVSDSGRVAITTKSTKITKNSIAFKFFVSFVSLWFSYLTRFVLIASFRTRPTEPLGADIPSREQRVGAISIGLEGDW